MLVFQEAVGAFVQISRKRGVMSKEGEKVGVSPYRSLGVRRLHSGAPDVDKFGRDKDKEPEKSRLPYAKVRIFRKALFDASTSLVQGCLTLMSEMS